MDKKQIRTLISQALGCYEAHILVGITAARAANPLKAQTHHRLSYKHWKIAVELLQYTFGGKFTGKFDLVLEPPTEEFHPASTELNHAFVQMREEMEMGLTVAFNQQFNDSDLKEYQVKLETLCQFIGKCLEYEYAPSENITVRTKKEVLTMEEYAERLGVTPESDTPKENHKIPDFMKSHPTKIAP